MDRYFSKFSPKFLPLLQDLQPILSPKIKSSMVQLIFGNEVTVDLVVKVCLVAAIGVVLVKLCCCTCRRGDRMMKAPGRGGAVMRRGTFEQNPRAYFRGLRSLK